MPTEVKIEPTSFLSRCVIHWKTRNYGLHVEHIALLLAVAIYMNKAIYEEELKSARKYLLSLLRNEDDADNIMEYVKMKLGNYLQDEHKWLTDRQTAFDMILKDEDLYGCMIDIFHSDKNFDSNEELFEKALKRLL